MADRLGSVRVRVTALATIVVAGVLVAAGALLVVRLRSDLVEQLDDGLAATADQLTAGLAGGGAVSPSADEDRIITVVDGSGTLLVGPPLATGAAPTTDDGQAIDVGGTAFHAVTRLYADPAGGEGVVQVAGSMDDIDESVRALVSSLAWIIPLATALLAVVVWFVVGRTLRPVERIRAEVAAIGMADLGRRVPVPAGHDEIARLAVTMNDMLDRLERSARRQRQFVADAAHELRTPLARMRAELEVDHRQPSTADAGATRQSQLEEVTALQRLTDDLLTLARNDDGGGPAVRVTRVDLDDLVLEELRALDPTLVALDHRRVSAAQVPGDRDDLRRIVRNVLDNASRHARTTVAVQLAEGGDHATLVVDDDGPGIPVERRKDVFERFARLDDARATGAGGSGLGLAIVHELVVAHGGRVDVGTSPLGGARFTVTLPR
jgi:signal transduction histidine kinase